MNEMQVFTNEQFGNVRTITENGITILCGADIAAGLGYKNIPDAISRHCPHVVKRDIGVQTGVKSDGSPAMQTIKLSFITEGDVYRLIAHSKLPAARQFESWVFDEVLPSIRKTGMYATPAKVEDILNNPDAFIEMLQAYKAEKEKNRVLEEQAAINAPKVEFADQVAECKNAIYMADLAKLLTQNSYKIGRDQLFELMRNEGFLLSRNGQWNRPSQYAMNRGLFKVVERVIVKNGQKFISPTTMVTPNGVKYFLKRYLVDKIAGQPLITEGW